ncbi:MAG: undecaprenyl-phosphate glucose phosphotransferase [Melioribacteraceae bacterium]|nr:undecaprenyl-phosphate glucose phosphotransferase [Saprospiraceae bacterium]MCF8356413.1 undecaprenyl-phosphate glucose phosphotransferase [Melioribacteraceae bacterium]MCF8396400.1 undecaprenyl-phosphate glucose phosphotransferase [Melioribacteraceae bacterium]
MQVQRTSIILLRTVLDFLCLGTAFILSIIINDSAKEIFSNSHLVLFAVVFIVWLFYSRSIGLYDEFRSKDFSFELISLIKVVYVIAIATIIGVFFIKEISLSRSFVLIFFAFVFGLMFVQKYILRRTLNYLRKKGRNQRNLLIVGAGEVGKNFYEAIKDNPHFGYRVMGFLDDQTKSYLNGQYLGSLDKLDLILEKNRVDNVLVALPNNASDKVEEVVRTCEQHTTRVKIIPDYFKVVSPKYSITMFGPFPVISVREDKVNALHWRIAKRIFDIMFTSVLFILFFWWLWPIIGLLIKLDSKGPVFYKQERWGRDNKRFTAFKFRSMKSDSLLVDENGKFLQATKDDPRITKLGAILRKTNIDELPQFWNVLKGDMSLVGPRPHPGPLNLESKKNIKQYMIRHLVKPGITGWAQVNGFRGETNHNHMLMQKRIEHDVWYIENWSFLSDIQIIFLTVWQMLKGDPNAY